MLGARTLLRAAIEAEVTAYLGRDRYERRRELQDARAGMRNGYCPTTVIILSRESDHAFDQGFSDEDSVIDAVLQAWPDENWGFVCRRVAAAEDVGSALFA